MTSDRPRVAVTGLGAITALGPDVRSLDEGLRAGRCAVDTLTLFDVAGLRTNLAGQAPDPAPLFEGQARLSGLPEGPTQPRLVANTSRPDRFGLQAAFEAVRDAGLAPADLERAACVLGTGTGGAALTEEYMRRLGHDGEAGADPSLLVSHQPCSVTDLVCRHLGIHGPRSTIMTACSSSATALGVAADQITLGRAEVALAGGAEGLCMLTYAGFACLRATSTERCKPFDAARSGLNLGEGAAAVVLESEVRARARGARIYGYLAGWGISADAHHMTAPHPTGDGAAGAMLAALADARLPASAVGYVNAHGTATPHNDAAESAALMRVFGDRVPPVSSTKSMLGHTLGAAGAIEAVVSLLALHHGYLPPTANHDTPDAAFANLDFIPGTARAQQVDAVLSSSFAFGGNNTVLAFTRQ